MFLVRWAVYRSRTIRHWANHGKNHRLLNGLLFAMGNWTNQLKVFHVSIPNSYSPLPVSQQITSFMVHDNTKYIAIDGFLAFQLKTNHVQIG